jgi:hypothetical protein
MRLVPTHIPHSDTIVDGDGNSIGVIYYTDAPLSGKGGPAAARFRKWFGTLSAYVPKSDAGDTGADTLVGELDIAVVIAEAQNSGFTHLGDVFYRCDEQSMDKLARAIERRTVEKTRRGIYAVIDTFGVRGYIQLLMEGKRMDEIEHAIHTGVGGLMEEIKGAD